MHTHTYIYPTNTKKYIYVYITCIGNLLNIEYLLKIIQTK